MNKFFLLAAYGVIIGQAIVSLAALLSGHKWHAVYWGSAALVNFGAMKI